MKKYKITVSETYEKDIFIYAIDEEEATDISSGIDYTFTDEDHKQTELKEITEI